LDVTDPTGNIAGPDEDRAVTEPTDVPPRRPELGLVDVVVRQGASDGSGSEEAHEPGPMSVAAPVVASARTATPMTAQAPMVTTLEMLPFFPAHRAVAALGSRHRLHSAG
jgi:hypothetical protein